MLDARARRGGADERRKLRRWLEYVAQTAIDWLDELDAAEVDLEDDDLGDEASYG